MASKFLEALSNQEKIIMIIGIIYLNMQEHLMALMYYLNQ